MAISGAPPVLSVPRSKQRPNGGKVDNENYNLSTQTAHQGNR